MTLITGGNQNFASAATDNCEVGIANAPNEFAATLRLEISAPATAGYRARTLTTDYALHIAPLPPLMIAAPEAPIMLAADASAGVAVLTVSLSGGKNPSFADADNGALGASGGGEAATITLATAAATAFASDNLTLSLTLTAIGGGGSETETATIRFVSAPRAIERADRFEIALRKRDAGEDAVVFSLSEASIAIWHNGAAAETYTIAQANADFTIAADEARLARALDVGVYAFTLRLTDGTLTASLPTQVSVGEPEKAALAQFVAQIEAGEIEWGTNIDPYDRTPTVYVDSAFGSVTVVLGGDGMESNPWAIYNVWQLQAIDGVSVSAEGEVDGDLTLTLFGNSVSDRLGAHYRLATDIDATPTRGWAGGGFRPIGDVTGSNPTGDFFQGALNGGGYEIRGLSVNINDGPYVGLFAGIGETGAVMSLQLSDLFVLGGSGSTGGLVGVSHGTVSLVGGTGVVIGGGRGLAGIGGLMGWLRGGDIAESWFTGKVEGGLSPSPLIGMGGLVGSAYALSPAGARNNWAQARVRDLDGIEEGNVGGLMGVLGVDTSFENGWSGSELFAENPRGLIGAVDTGASGVGGYSDSSTSGLTEAAVGISARSVDTMVTVSDPMWLNDVWVFGDSDFGDTDVAADYPFLQRYETMRPGAQAVAYAAQQIRWRADGAEATLGDLFMLDEGGALTLDTNGLAADQAPSPSCMLDAASGEVRAETNYNHVTVILRPTNGAVLSLPVAGDCGVEYPDEGAAFSILAVVSAGEAAETVSYSFTVTTVEPLVIDSVPDPVIVAAGASAGVTVLTLSVSGGGMNPSFADADNGDLGASGGDDEATITLATAATAAFASDNLTLSVILTASAGDGRKTATATIRFVSAPRVIERADRFEIALRKSNTGENAAVLPLSEARISIWHNGAAAETYSIAQANADFKIASDEVRAARALDVGVYAFTLRLTDGTLTASLPAQVSVGDPEKAARAQFAAQIAAGEVEWWTQINPYDRTPTVYDDPVFGSVTVDLFDGAEGTATKPWPIYNVWHLQAINGVSVSDENEVSVDFNNFRIYGDSSSVRLGAHYYLAVDIDAATTRLWEDGEGFKPIGSGHPGDFLGSIDGRGNAVRGLFINRSVSVGLIEQLGAGGTIKHLGVEEAEVRGSGGNAGILAALNQGNY